VYTTCAFCNGGLDGDGGPSGLGVGKRFAFDGWRGRLWVICGRCSRWNLSPLDDRLERVEALERAAAQGRVAATTENISLIRFGAYDLVRVGKPPRVEFATWRYGERLKARRRERLKYVIPFTIVAGGLVVAVNAAAGGSFGFFAYNLSGIADAIYRGMVGRRLVRLSEPPVCDRCGEVMHLQARHVQYARLIAERQQDLSLLLSCPRCRSDGALLTGPDAEAALRQGLTYVNLKRGGKHGATRAASSIEAVGGPEELIRRIAKDAVPIHRLRRPSKGSVNLSLPLEMAVDEIAEVRELERQWREAEEIAEIADGMLSPNPQVEDQLRSLKQQGGSQPNG
jgi:hypothetical protein